MRAKGIDPRLLDFDLEGGRIDFMGYRMVLMSACALGAVRRELIDTLGLDAARGVMKRFGHAAGVADGKALLERFPGATRAEHLDFGPALHGLEGVANIVRVPEATHIDPDAGHCHFEAYWENSYEAEQHLALFGPSDVPVCWTLVGYATGHSTTAAGRRTLVVETECKAMGAERCRFVGDYVENFDAKDRREMLDYEKRHLPEELEALVTRIESQKRELRTRERRIQELEVEIAELRTDESFLGESQVFVQVLQTARSVAPVDTTVLIQGESGSGKELLARYVHAHSLRASGPILAMNSSALPESLQEAELFGYAKGAFTGASVATPGIFEAAHGGTLFLDEIGDLSATAQTKILRVLQEGEVKRIGETRVRKVDVRVIAATHRDLRQMVEEKSFREDLYYRLSVVGLELPPLRDRGHDVVLLAEHFLAHYAERFRRKTPELTRRAKQVLLSYAWPGNVRELENAMQRATILSERPYVDAEDLPAAVHAGAPLSARIVREASIDVVSIDPRAALRSALAASGGKREVAAAMLGISRTTLWRRMKRYGIELDPGPQAEDV